jgi:hypothetical protein
MPDQGDPTRDLEERFAAAVEPGRPFGTPDASDPELARDLEIAGMLRALGPGFSANGDARARVRARVMGALATDGGVASAPPVPESAPDGAPTEQLPVVAPAPVRDEPTHDDARHTGPTVRAEAADADRSTALRAVSAREETAPSTTVLAEPDLARALRPRRRRRHALPSRPAARPAATGLARRVATVGAAALFAVLAIAGGSIFASRDAVPGDALYGIKRAAEAAGGIFSGSNARGQHDLELAATRLDEIERMARAGVTDGAAFDSAFDDFDSATTAGTRRQLSGANPDRSAVDLASWATQQTTRLSTLRSTLPAAAQSDAEDALQLLDRVHRRAVALTARTGCADVTSGATDDLGPVPAEGPCTTRQAAGSASGQAGSAPTERARTASGTATGQQADGATAQQRSQQDGDSDSALVQGGSGGSGGEDAAAATPTTTAARSSDNKNNVNVPLPLPITVPPLVNGKGGLLG